MTSQDNFVQLYNEPPLIQGDVSIRRIGIWNGPNLAGKGSKIELASGESGNIHVIDDVNVMWLDQAIKLINEESGSTFTADPTNRNKFVVFEAAEVAHVGTTEKSVADTHHAPLNLEPGVYEFDTQVEFSYRAQAPRPVFD